MNDDDKLSFRMAMAAEYAHCVIIIGDGTDDDELAMPPMEIGG